MDKMIKIIFKNQFILIGMKYFGKKTQKFHKVG